MSTQPEPPRDAEGEEAAFKAMGHAIRALRERRDMGRRQLASMCEMSDAELEQVEGGEVDESWGGLRLISKALDIPLAALIAEVEEVATAGEVHRTREGNADAPR
ncbi:MAG: helix-turn-helix domain-containing protein [Solirubrobacterales bacterium]